MKNIDKKRKVQLFIIFMIAIALLAGSVTYALIELNIIYRGNQENTISSCSLVFSCSSPQPVNNSEVKNNKIIFFFIFISFSI